MISSDDLNNIIGDSWELLGFFKGDQKFIIGERVYIKKDRVIKTIDDIVNTGELIGHEIYSYIINGKTYNNNNLLSLKEYRAAKIKKILDSLDEEEH